MRLDGLTPTYRGMASRWLYRPAQSPACSVTLDQRREMAGVVIRCLAIPLFKGKEEESQSHTNTHIPSILPTLTPAPNGAVIEHTPETNRRIWNDWLVRRLAEREDAVCHIPVDACIYFIHKVLVHDHSPLLFSLSLHKTPAPFILYCCSSTVPAFARAPLSLFTAASTTPSRATAVNTAQHLPIFKKKHSFSSLLLF